MTPQNKRIEAAERGVVLKTRNGTTSPAVLPRTRGRSDTPQRPRQAALRSTSGAPGPGRREAAGGAQVLPPDTRDGTLHKKHGN